MKVICAQCLKGNDFYAKDQNCYFTEINEHITDQVYCGKHGLLLVPNVNPVLDKVIAVLAFTDKYPYYEFFPSLELLGLKFNKYDPRILHSDKWNIDKFYRTNGWKLGIIKLGENNEDNLR